MPKRESIYRDPNINEHGRNVTKSLTGIRKSYFDNRMYDSRILLLLHKTTAISMLLASSPIPKEIIIRSFSPSNLGIHDLPRVQSLLQQRPARYHLHWLFFELQ